MSKDKVGPFLVMLRYTNFDFPSISIRFLAHSRDFDTIRFYYE